MSAPKRRKSGLTTLDLHKLELACQQVWEGFGSGTSGSTYLVGTAQTGGKYRDVDVRTILPDDEFDALFCRPDTNGRALWSLLCSSIGRMLAEQTGLPIDYQIQRATQANEKYPGGNRNPIGHGRRDYAGGGDATRFDPPRTARGGASDG
jgi:hypothetical protein